MGAFFLYRKDVEHDLPAVKKVFQRKGFSQPRQIELSNWMLWHYPKIMECGKNYIEAEDGLAIYATGTVVYKKLGYQDSLKALVKDFRIGQFNRDALLGNFCILFRQNDHLTMLRDDMGVYHIFDTQNRTCVSSSFLAVVAAGKRKWPLNRSGLYEALSTGYSMRPDTLLSGIRNINDGCASEYASEEGLMIMPSTPLNQIVPHDRGITDSLSHQVQAIEEHFVSMDALHSECFGELGLSSGYDSRLVLASSRYLSKPMNLHTHATEGVHDRENAIVRQIATDLKLSLVKKQTRSVSQLTAEEIQAVMMSCLYYFDGRCSHNMGSFSETYTKEYWIEILADNKLSWNGLGGEMYRNYYYCRQTGIPLKNWFDHNVFYPFAPDAIGNTEAVEQMKSRFFDKIYERIGKPDSFKIDLHWLRRYYSLIRMPDGDAANNNAHNQLAFFHTPFMDRALVKEGVAATAYIQTAGEYEGALIALINDKLAAYSSHYGYPLNKIPCAAQLKARAKSFIPVYLQRERLRKVLSKRRDTIVGELAHMTSKSSYVNQVWSLVDETVLEGDSKSAVLDYAQRPTTLFIGSFLNEFHDKIRW